MKVENMTSTNGNKVANQFIIRDGKRIIFQSYDSIIAVIECGRITLDKNLWNCSRTTSKYRNMFTELTTEETKRGIKAGKILLDDLNK